MKTLVRSIIMVIVAAGLLPAAVQAATLTFEHFDSAGIFSDAQRGVSAGEFNVTLKNEDDTLLNGGGWFTAFCVELSQSIGVGQSLSDSIRPELFGDGHNMGLKAAWLFDTYYDENATDTDIAALQLAIWSVTNSFDPTSGNPSAAIDRAELFLNSLDGNFSTADTAYLNQTYTIFTSDTLQDLIVMTGQPVPEPTTVALMVVGLVGLIGVVRRQRG